MSGLIKFEFFNNDTKFFFVFMRFGFIVFWFIFNIIWFITYDTIPHLFREVLSTNKFKINETITIFNNPFVITIFFI